jgi:hypothetical protein
MNLFRCNWCTSFWHNRLNLNKHLFDFPAGSCATSGRFTRRIADHLPRQVALPGAVRANAAHAAPAAPAAPQADDGGLDGDGGGGADDGVDDGGLSDEQLVEEADDDVWACIQRLRLTGGQILEFLALLNSLGDRQASTGQRSSLRTVAQVEALTKKKLEAAEDGWTSAAIGVEASEIGRAAWPAGSGHKLEVVFEHRNMHHALTKMFGEEAYQGHFVTEAARVQEEGGPRILNHPHETDTWLYAQKRIRDFVDELGVIAAGQLYSDKTLVNRKGESVMHRHAPPCAAMHRHAPPCSLRHAAHLSAMLAAQGRASTLCASRCSTSPSGCVWRA